MKEVCGDLWSYEGRKGFDILVTTNGTIKHDGTAVMGRGCALEAAERYPELPRLLGQSLLVRGNVVSRLLPHLLSFPVKNRWYEDADPELIKRSAKDLQILAEDNPQQKYVLPRPGCGNGNLEWKKVKPLLKKLPDNVFVISKEV